MREGDKVDLIIGNETPLGFVVLINEDQEGLLYHNEIFTPIKSGERLIGFIKKIREDEKIDVSLTPQGFKNIIEELISRVLNELERNNGILNLSDKSSPEEIKIRLEMSKKNFKKAIGKLYKDKKIEITKDKIMLIKK